MAEHTLKNEYLQGPDEPIAPCIPQKDFSRNEYTLGHPKKCILQSSLGSIHWPHPRMYTAGGMQTHAKKWRYSMLLFCAVAVTQRKNRGYKTSVIAAVNSVEERERAEKWAKPCSKKSWKIVAWNSAQITHLRTQDIKHAFLK